MDPLWKYVLDESSDDDSYDSYNSRRHKRKQVRWRLPRRAEENIEEEHSIFAYLIKNNDGEGRNDEPLTQRSKKTSRKKTKEDVAQEETGGFFDFFTSGDESRTDEGQKRNRFRSRKARSDQNETREDTDKKTIWGFFDTSNGETTEKGRMQANRKKTRGEPVTSGEPKADLFGLFASNDGISSNRDSSEQSDGGGFLGYFLNGTDEDDYTDSSTREDDSTACSSKLENISAFESELPANGKEDTAESVESFSVASNTDSCSDCHSERRRQDEPKEEGEATPTLFSCSNRSSDDRKGSTTTNLPDNGIHLNTETHGSRLLCSRSKTNSTSRNDGGTRNEIEANKGNFLSRKQVSLPKLLGRVKCRSAAHCTDNELAGVSMKPTPAEGDDMHRGDLAKDQKGTNTNSSVNRSVARTAGDHEGSVARPLFAAGGGSRDSFFPDQGPQSVYVFDWDSNNHMGVFYDKFGMDEALHVSTLNFPSVAEYETSEVVIRVEASTVSYSDCAIRRGDWWKEEVVPLPNCPGVDLIGHIYHIDKRIAAKYNLQIGDRAMSFIKWGGNARYVAVKAEQLVPVKEDIDPSEAVCLIETYLSAFQALHIGQKSGVRYGSQSLAGKSILVLGAMSSMGKAVLEVAIVNGANKVYAPARDKHQADLRSRGIRPLDRSPERWMERLRRKIDLVLIADVQKSHASLPEVLHENGHLIFVGKRVSADHSFGQWQHLLNRTHAYDIFESWERNMKSCKRDLAYLLQLLASGVLKPTVLDRIPLDKVARAQELLHIKQFPGIVVCEPWIKGKRRAVYL